MEEGFPGKLKVEVSFLVTPEHELCYNWKAWLVEGQSAVKTPISLANHTMWNLSGNFTDKTIHNHQLRLYASKTLEMDPEQIP